MMIIHDKFGNKFKSSEEAEKFYNEYDAINEEFCKLLSKSYGETADDEITNVIYQTQIMENGVNIEFKTPKSIRLMKNMIDKYKHPHSSVRNLLLSKNSGKLVSPRDKHRGIDIWDADAKKVERDEEEYRKKKSTKSKPKRKVIKKCKCK